MACFCISIAQFYMHTFQPTNLVAGVKQGHLLRLINASAQCIETVRAQLITLDGQPQVVYVNIREDDDTNGDHIFEALVELAPPRPN